MNWITDLFKKRPATSERMEIIFRRGLKLNDMFLSPRQNGTLTIITYAVKTTNRRGKVSYEIKQALPLTSDPYYDGEFNTNRIIERYGKSEWILAQEAIDKDKIDSQTKIEEP